MPKITPRSPVLTGALLGRSIPLVLNPRRVAPVVDPVVVTPPPGPVQNGPIVNPSTPPAGLTGPKLVAWVAVRLAEQESLRAGSFWDTGYLLGLLMPARVEFGFADLKALIDESGLPISHFTAQKYLMVARSFDRETAKNTGIEKCYALTLYAKAVNRAGQAALILANNERIVGTELPPLRSMAKTISASQLLATVHRMKAAAKEEKVPTAVQAEREKLSKDTARAARSMGFKNPSTRLVRHDGKTKIAIYVSLEDAQAWPATRFPAIAKMLAKEAKKQPQILQLLKATVPGLTLKRAS